MKKTKADVYAKINLTLDITGEQGDYHEIDSLVCTVDIFDRIVAKKRKDRCVKVVMRGMWSEGIPEENNALRAAQLFVSEFDTLGADITVHRNIPVCAGLGSSSADAAGVLKALAQLYEITDVKSVRALADRLGSDTAYMLKGGTARLRGRGDRIERLSITPKLHFFLLCPRTGVSTAECYRKSDEYAFNRKSRTEGAVKALLSGDTATFASYIGNDLYEAAAELNPDVKRALDEAAATNPLGAGMTGSGSAAFAVFTDETACARAVHGYRGRYRAYYLRTVGDSEPPIWRNLSQQFEERWR